MRAPESMYSRHIERGSRGEKRAAETKTGGNVVTVVGGGGGGGGGGGSDAPTRVVSDFCVGDGGWLGKLTVVLLCAAARHAAAPHRADLFALMLRPSPARHLVQAPAAALQPLAADARERRGWPRTAARDERRTTGNHER